MPGYSSEYTWVSGSTASMKPPSPNAGCDDDGVMFRCCAWRRQTLRAWVNRLRKNAWLNWSRSGPAPIGLSGAIAASTMRPCP